MMMTRFLLFCGLLLGVVAAPVARAADALPPRPKPFQFVNDQAGILKPADVKTLEGGLRRYADQNGPQVVLLTVADLGGRTAADYARAIGNAWGVGQRDKNNGVVVVVAAKDRKVAIEAGSGLADKITPAVKQRIISQDFGPNFKQGNYFAGLRKGLSALMLAANPASDPRKATGNETATSAATPATSSAALASSAAPATPTGANELGASPTPVEPASSGPGFGTLLLGALGLGAVFLLVRRLFSRKDNNANQTGGGPNFYPNQPNRPVNPTPNFGAPQGPTGYGPNYGPGYGAAPQQQGGMMGGMGGILATGAAAAAGAYLGNKMAGGGHDSGSAQNFDNANQAGLGGLGAAGLGGAAGAAGTGAAGDYFANRDGGSADSDPDYFNNVDDSSSGGDYFSADDNSSYDDASSGDFGGGGFDGGGDDSGSW